MRPFTSGPIWGGIDSQIERKEIQEDHVSSSSTSFAITGLGQTAVTRDTGPKVKCSFESLKSTKPSKSTVHNRLGGGGGGVEVKKTVKNRLGARPVKSRLGL